MAFTTQAMDVCLVRDGTTETLWACDTSSIMTVITHPSACYGVSYSLERTLLLRGTDILVERRDESANSSALDLSGKAVIAIPVGDPGASWELLRVPLERGLPAMNRVVYGEREDRIWLSQISQIPSEANAQTLQHILLTAQPHTSDLGQVALGRPFGGDFAVSPDGSAIFYLGLEQGSPAATLRTDEGERELFLDLATAYHPVFSPDGAVLCLVGSEKLDGPTSLWLYDLESGDCRQMKSTEGLTPTYPSFSPDGERVAFRHFGMGEIWMVTVDDGALMRYALTTDEAPIAW